VEYNDLAAGRTGRAIALVGAVLGGVILAIVLTLTSEAGRTTRLSD
jgi:hypothetical protein